MLFMLFFICNTVSEEGSEYEVYRLSDSLLINIVGCLLIQTFEVKSVYCIPLNIIVAIYFIYLFALQQFNMYNVLQKPNK